MTQTIGSRRQVWNGTVKRTSGGLTKNDLMMSHGRIVSKSKHFSAKKEMRLLKHGYGTKKGKFGYVKIGTKKHNKKMRGGHSHIGAPLSPARIDGQEGGRRRNYSFSGGSGMRPMHEVGSANWNGDDSTGNTYSNSGSNNLQFLAGMAGGKKYKMKGGTGKQMPYLNPANVDNRALMA